MSAPLVVNTRDGVCWTRRTVTSGGIALYAPESVKTCPDFVMATEAELAEHGIVGSADALPMPVGPEPQGERLSIARIAEIQQRAEAATPGPWEEHAAYGENFYAYLGGPYLRGVGTLNFGDGDDAEADKALTVNAREDIRALLSELFTVRAELRVARGRVAELEAAAKEIQRLHTDSPMGPCPVCIDGDAMVRGDDYTLPYPCPTARLAGAKDCDPPSQRKASRPLVEWCTGCNTDHNPDECGYRPGAGDAR